MSNYTRQRQTALRLLKDKGQAMTLVRVNPGSYDPTAPEDSVATIQDISPASGVLLPANNATISNFDDTILNDPQRLKSFRYFIVAGLDLTFQLEAGDHLGFSEGYAKIIGTTKLDPDGQGPIIYYIGSTMDASFSLPPKEELELEATV